MKLPLCLALSSLAACAAVQSSSPTPVPVSGAERENRLGIYLGQRQLDEDEWSPLDEQPMFGLEYSRETQGDTVGFEVGIMGSADEDTVAGSDVEVSTGEFYGGIRKTFGEEVFRPYVGAGLSLVNLEVDTSGLGDDDDASAAFYAHGGLAILASEALLIGLDLRFLIGSDIEIAGVDTDADYVQLALFLGIGF
ncbi:MAG: outer membrane beta-barrel protein [Planctomycetota bacterium]